MKYTDNHNMNLPETTDNVDIEKLNENFVTIDGMLIAHPTSQNPTVTTSPTTLDWGNTFAVVTNITRDNNGHAKTFDVKTLKLPEIPATKNVIAPVPNVPVNITSNGDVFLNHVVDGAIASSHKIQGNGGAKISTAAGSETDGDGVIVITSSCVKNGTFTHDSANMTIDTGFTETPKLFKLYYTTDGNTVELAAECRPELDAPFNFINNSSLPINSIEFDGGAATVNCSVATGLSFMWESYI